MKYPAKKDAWAAWLFALGVLVLIGMGIFIAMTDLVVGVVVTAPMVLFFCSIYLWASYEITSWHVVVRAGPLPICRVRIDEIMEATPTSSISATAHFALSSDAIRIEEQSNESPEIRSRVFSASHAGCHADVRAAATSIGMKHNNVVVVKPIDKRSTELIMLNKTRNTGAQRTQSVVRCLCVSVSNK